MRCIEGSLSIFLLEKLKEQQEVSPEIHRGLIVYIFLKYFLKSEEIDQDIHRGLLVYIPC